MKASELAKNILTMVADFGDHEIGVDGGDAYLDGGVAEVEFVMPTVLERDLGGEPHYLIRCWIGAKPAPALTVSTCNSAVKSG